MIRKFGLAIAIIAMSYSSFAEGYAVNAQGNKQAGMGHVGTALNWDASSLFFNPGALATLKQRISFTVGGTAALVGTEYVGKLGTYKTDNPIGTPFYLYGAMKLNDKLSIGLGVYTPFGNTVDWGKDWAGRYLMQDINVKAIYIQPTVSYRICDKVSIGAGFNIVYASLDMNKALPLAKLGAADGQVNIQGSNIFYGYNLGIFIQPTDKLNIGISYRSKVDVKFEYENADATFTVPESISSFFPDSPIAAGLPLVATLNLGVAYQLNSKWLVSGDINYVFWDKYKSLDFDFKNESIPDSKSPRDWTNSVSYRFGAQFTANEKLDLRAGLLYDMTPANKQNYTPETPGANKKGLTAGATYKLNSRLSVDVSVMFIPGNKVEGSYTDPESGYSFGGQYENKGWLPGIGISYNL